jgi:hypothetical protein
MALTHADVEAGFAQVRAERELQKRMADVRDAGFWRALNPDLTISDFPLAGRRERTAPTDAAVARCRAQLLADGYLHSPPLVPRGETARLAAGIERIVAHGLPAALAAVYDEYYNVFTGMESVFAPLLGPDYIMVTQGVAAFYVPAGADGRSLWSASSPHRDRMGPDARTLAHDVPSILTLWLPVTDVTTEHSCIYVVPAPADPGFYSADMNVEGKFRYQDIRALPAEAGSVLSWSSHLLHWGSSASPFAATPRMAVTMYFQRRDVPLWHPFHLDPARPCSFEERLTWIDHGMARPGLIGGVKVEGA